MCIMYKIDIILMYIGASIGIVGIVYNNLMLFFNVTSRKTEH